MNDTTLVAAPQDGIIIKNKSSKYALVYNKSSKTFDSYYQYSKEDLENYGEDEEPIDDTPEEAIIDSTAN